MVRALFAGVVFVAAASTAFAQAPAPSAQPFQAGQPL